MASSAISIIKYRKDTKKIMKSEILQNFKAVINTIIFTDEMNYTSTEYVLNKIEEKFGEIYTDEFISELSYAIERISIKCENFAFSDLENSLTNNIETAEKFEDIKFEYPYIPSDLNERIAAGEFTKK